MNSLRWTMISLALFVLGGVPACERDEPEQGTTIIREDDDDVDVKVEEEGFKVDVEVDDEGKVSGEVEVKD